MDQVYIPKNRIGFSIGNYVIIKPLEEKKPEEKLYFYGVKHINSVKLGIVKEIMSILDSRLENYENIIIAGSFLDEGFQFNDLDIILINKNEITIDKIKKDIEKKIGITLHFLNLDNKTLAAGLETDPFYQMLLSKCISKKRFIYKSKHRINYKLLDLHLLKSKTLIDNFDILSGNEKYDLVRNLMTISFYLDSRKISKELVDAEIKKNFGLKDINELKKNLVNKKTFLKEYKQIYDKTFTRILRGIKDGAKQE